MTMEQMKAMADRKAAPLLEKLNANPTDAATLGQLGALYGSAHQFPQSAKYYRKALESDPKNLGARTQLASSLYYGGEVDEALKQLQQVLKSDPKNANALFNLGMMKWKGKDDAAGAIATWQELLRSNPNLDRKSTVEQMIAEARASQLAASPAQPQPHRIFRQRSKPLAEITTVSNEKWTSGQAYGIAIVCLLLGLAGGWFIRRLQAPAKTRRSRHSGSDPESGRCGA